MDEYSGFPNKDSEGGKFMRHIQYIMLESITARTKRDHWVPGFA